MAEETTMKLEVVVPISADGLISVDQYGMEYPDGSIKWGIDSGAHAGVNGFSFDRLKNHSANSTSLRDWRWVTDRRAKEGKVDPDVYFNGHKFLRRTVIVGAMKPEKTALQKPSAEPAW